jgi:hypothetical protein
MSLARLSTRDREIVHQCLRAVADDDTLFPEWEFDLLFGLTRGEFVQIADRWPEIDERIPDVTTAIVNALNNLLGYPHDRHETWTRHFAFTPEELQNVLDKF